MSAKKKISDLLKLFQILAPSSGVARVPCALGKKYCCASTNKSCRVWSEK